MHLQTQYTAPDTSPDGCVLLMGLMGTSQIMSCSMLVAARVRVSPKQENRNRRGAREKEESAEKTNV
jgi:hypothetical protein